MGASFSILDNFGKDWHVGGKSASTRFWAKPKNTTDRGTAAKTGDQGPGSGERLLPGQAMLSRSPHANESWQPCLPLTTWWPHLEAVDPPILIY